MDWDLVARVGAATIYFVAFLYVFPFYFVFSPLNSVSDFFLQTNESLYNTSPKNAKVYKTLIFQALPLYLLLVLSLILPPYKGKKYTVFKSYIPSFIINLPSVLPTITSTTLLYLTINILYVIVYSVSKTQSANDVIFSDSWWMHLGNILSFAACINLSLFLIPITLHSNPLLAFFQIDMIQATKFHIMAANFCVVFAGLHGAVHFFRFVGLEGEKPALINWAFPKWECFVDLDYDLGIDCEYDCNCYSLVRNFTGVAAFLLFLTVTLLATKKVRRYSYNIFLTSHLLLTPLAFYLLFMHWSKMYIYILPSMAIYVFGKVKRFGYVAHIWLNGGNKVVLVEEIVTFKKNCVTSSSNSTVHSSVVRIFIEFINSSAEPAFLPGQFIRIIGIRKTLLGGLKDLLLPNGHPYSIVSNAPSSNHGNLELLIRGASVWSRSMIDSLSPSPPSSTPTSKPLTLIIEGPYGPTTRIKELQSYSTVYYIAAGIGITPWLSVLSHIASDSYVPPPSSERRIVKLIWVCPDRSLIKSLLPTLKNLRGGGLKNNVDIEVIVHCTSIVSIDLDLDVVDGRGKGKGKSEGVLTVIDDEDDVFGDSKLDINATYAGIPFDMNPRYRLISMLQIISYPLLAYFIAVSFYKSLKGEKELISRLYAPIVYSLSVVGLVFVPYVLQLTTAYLTKSECDVGFGDKTKLLLSVGGVEAVGLTDENGNENGSDDGFEMPPFDEQGGNKKGEVDQGCGAVVKNGRPNVSEIVKDLTRAFNNEKDETKCCAIFVCAASNIVAEVREGAAWKFKKNVLVENRKVVVYEEEFGW